MVRPGLKFAIICRPRRRGADPRPDSDARPAACAEPWCRGAGCAWEGPSARSGSRARCEHCARPSPADAAAARARPRTARPVGAGLPPPASRGLLSDDAAPGGSLQEFRGFWPNVTVCCHGVGPIEQRALASDHRVTTLLANAELFLQGRGPNEARPGCHPQVLRYISATICSIFDSHSGLTIPLTRLEAARSLPHFGI
jgi:hypothetical protein